ncbi:MAG TPA: hypothetical protein VN256_02250 [Pyrinomonadaceae bacterium]|nr:hypothetical protein [Pyrinomonadaceae bacterium]
MRNNSRTPDKTKKQKKSRLSAPRVVALLAVAAVVIGLGTIVFSQSGNKHPRAKTAKAAPAKTDKTYVATKETIFDPASGKTRKPTAEETQELVAQLSSLTNRTTEGLTGKQLPNGTQQITLEGRFGGVMLGRAREDGTTEMRCVTTMEEAVAFLGLEEATK